MYKFSEDQLNEMAVQEFQTGIKQAYNIEAQFNDLQELCNTVVNDALSIKRSVLLSLPEYLSDLRLFEDHVSQLIIKIALSCKSSGITEYHICSLIDEELSRRYGL